VAGHPRRLTVPVLYFNVHVPKNGGQTLDTILRRYFGAGFARAPDGRPGSLLSESETAEFLWTCACTSTPEPNWSARSRL
jgi:hypothetical protein